VTKTDLFPNLREPLFAWYEHDTRSPFVAARMALLQGIGADSFPVVTRLVAARFEDFVWGQQRLPTSMEEATRDRLLREWLETIEQMCARSTR